MSVAPVNDNRCLNSNMKTGSSSNLCSNDLDLIRPSQTGCFLGTKIEEIKKAVRALYMAKNITDIGAVREQGVDGFNEFIFVLKGKLLSFGMSANLDGPKPDVSDVAAGETIFVVCAAQMDQVASLVRPSIGFIFGSAHRWTVVRYPIWAMRRSMKRL